MKNHFPVVPWFELDYKCPYKPCINKFLYKYRAYVNVLVTKEGTRYDALSSMWKIGTHKNESLYHENDEGSLLSVSEHFLLLHIQGHREFG